MAEEMGDAAWMECRSKLEKLRNQEARFVVLAGNDLGGGTLEVIYLFVHGGEFVEVRYEAPLDRTLPTVTDLFPAALMLERELVDLMGVNVEGAEPYLLLEAGSGVTAPLRRSLPPTGAEHPGEEDAGGD